MLAEPSNSGKYLPFCSERCRLIDLGRWLNEEHTLTAEASDDELGSDNPSHASGASPVLPPGWHDA